MRTHFSIAAGCVVLISLVTAAEPDPLMQRLCDAEQSIVDSWASTGTPSRFTFPSGLPPSVMREVGTNEALLTVLASDDLRSTFWIVQYSDDLRNAAVSNRTLRSQIDRRIRELMFHCTQSATRLYIGNLMTSYRDANAQEFLQLARTSLTNHAVAMDVRIDMLDMVCLHRQIYSIITADGVVCRSNEYGYTNQELRDFLSLAITDESSNGIAGSARRRLFDSPAIQTPTNGFVIAGIDNALGTQSLQRSIDRATNAMDKANAYWEAMTCGRFTNECIAFLGGQVASNSPYRTSFIEMLQDLGVTNEITTNVVSNNRQ